MEETPLGLLIPDDEDPPDGPGQIGPNAEKVDSLLHLAGAQSKGIVVPGEETVKAKGSAWLYMPTPDRVTGIVVPAGAKCSILVNYWALWTGVGTSRAALCVNGVPVKIAEHEGFWRYIAAAGENSSGANWKPLTSCDGGLVSVEATADSPAPPASGYLNAIYPASSQGLSWAVGVGPKPEEISNLIDQEEAQTFMGGPADLILPEGEYEIGVKFGIGAAGESNIKRKNARLHVWLREFL